MSISKERYANLKSEILLKEFRGLQEMVEYAERLKRQNQLRYARCIVEEALAGTQASSDASQRRKLAWLHSLFIYKDPALCARERFRRSIDVLAEVNGLLANADMSPQTLCLAGDIYKLNWELLNLRRRETDEANDGNGQAPGTPLDVVTLRYELEQALSYYNLSYEQNAIADYGYACLNMAFVTDALAALPSPAADPQGLRQEAAARRRELAPALATLMDQPDSQWLKEKWWYLFNLAECHLGVGDAETALSFVKAATKLPGVPAWAFEATAWRFFTLIRIHEIVTDRDEYFQIFVMLAMRLKADHLFSDARQIFSQARRLLARAEGHPTSAGLRLLLAQQHALCTYKDQDLPVDRRLDRALEILGEVENLAETSVQETLGIAGAIYKRKWEVNGQKQNLERSLHYYRKGYVAGDTSREDYDNGYTGINAAFVLDLLAHLEATEAGKAGTISRVASERREEADTIRRDLVKTLTARSLDPLYEWLNRTWWFPVTLGEAYFGLGEYEDATTWLTKAAELLPMTANWERETTMRQLVALSNIRRQAEDLSSQIAMSGARQALRGFLSNSEEALQSAYLGKIGLALSGGGFRASLFHIGMLAKLAELDVLRHVEIISGVSGGAIVGAYYYLEVQKLLQEKTDDKITREDYIKIVQRLEENFLAGVQQNIRMLVVRGIGKNLKMLGSAPYSRTKRVGELYEEILYSRIKDGKEAEERWMDQLVFTPLGEDETLSPKFYNWRRRAKVPILILNATTLNTGHNWQFTGTWMGEPPAGINTEVDANHRLRRMYLWEAPAAHQDVRLGYAVAASACVPGVFAPLTLEGLYADQTVLLVDGGVHDNQGVGGLLEQDCNVLLVSDASGQMQTSDTPGMSILNVLFRTDTIFQARLRGAQYNELDARRRASLLRGLLFIHLMKDLDESPVNWNCCEDSHDPFQDLLPAFNGRPETSYHIRKDVQRLLALIRTDLDSFNRQESYALMTSGYRMTQFEFQDCVRGFSERAEARPRWRFLAIEDLLRGENHTEQEFQSVIRLLTVGQSAAFKIWWLSRRLQVVAVLLLSIIVVLLFLTRDWWWSVSLITLGWIAMLLIAYVTQLIAGKTAAMLLQIRSEIKQVIIKFALCVLGPLVVWVHLRGFDKWFLERGEMDLSGHQDWQARFDETSAGARTKEDMEPMMALAEEGHSPAQRFEAYRAIGRRWQSLGRDEVGLEEYERALEYYEKALNIEPTDLDSRRSIGIMKNRLGRRDEALDLVGKIIEENPGDAESWSLLGRLHKEAWLNEWRRDGSTVEQMRQRAALSEKHLRASLTAYTRGFNADPSSYYAGSNALMLLHLLFYLTPVSDIHHSKLRTLAQEVYRAIANSIGKEKDYWATVTLADAIVLCGSPEQVVRAYGAAVEMAVDKSNNFGLDSSKQQLLILRDLEFRKDAVNAALQVFEEGLKKIELKLAQPKP
jgi:predicted acylesterase/phospholipase RssA/tetratricopeptide (TPR) repeat protein